MVAQQPPSSAGTIDATLLNRAISALLKHHEATTSNSNSLLDDDECDIQVQFTLARVPGNPSVKPIRIDLPHSLVKLDSNDDDDDDDSNLSEATVCLIVKDSSKPQIQQLITRFPNELSCIKKVLTLTSLRQKHSSYAQKRSLLSRYDVFMADDRILPMLSKALGCKFFDKKRQPVPVNICREEALPFAVRRCLMGTFMWLSGGTCVTVRAGTTTMSPTKLHSNILAICNQTPLKVPRKWANIKSISIKTTNSVALPVYNKTLEELELIKDMADVGKTENEKRESDFEKNEVEKKRKEMAEKSPLARALKKQKSSKKEKKEIETKNEVDGDDAIEMAESKDVTKSSKKKRKGKVVDETMEETDNQLKTPKSKEAEGGESVKSKSSKKSKKKAATEADDEDAQENEENVGDKSINTPKPNKDEVKTKSSKKRKKNKADKEETEEATSLKTPQDNKVKNTDAIKSKSSKKAKQEKETSQKDTQDATSSTKKTKQENPTFIPSKKYTGSKSGYVFRKDKQGTGYYRDVLPVVDKVWLAGLAKGKGRKSVGGGGFGGGKKKKGGRRSF